MSLAARAVPASTAPQPVVQSSIQYHQKVISKGVLASTRAGRTAAVTHYHDVRCCQREINTIAV